MPYSIEVFCRRAQYEPSTTWYCSTTDATSNLSDTLENIATGLQRLMSNTAECNRFEVFNADGIKINDGPLSGYTGLIATQVSDPKEFLLIRKNVSGEVEKPSVLYVPFVPIGFVVDGELTEDGETAFALATASWLASTIWNSDGLPVNSYTFRHKTRRKKVRRVL